VKLQGRLQRDVNWVKVSQEGERMHSGKARKGPSYGSKSAKGLGEREQELKASRYDYTKERIKVVIQISKCFTVGLKSKSTWRLLGFCLVFKRR